MEKPTLVIGNKNYSSWSLRAWLCAKQASLDFKEIRLPLHTPEFEEKISNCSPSGRVPVFIDGNVTVWESLAICEYLAERFPKAHLWPEDSKARAFARSVSNEMHAGFQALRQSMPMNCRARFPGKGLAAEVQEDINRITTIWNECRECYEREGKLLFGRFTIPDAMFAPVVLRFITYEVNVDPISKAYMEAVLALPATKEWLEAASQEIERIP